MSKTEWDTAALIAADKRYVWHPFTAMSEWCAPESEPLVLVKGEGALLWDSDGRRYIDGNSSIWTNIHGHNHPCINAAIVRQLDRVAHTSFLGFTNPPAIRLAEGDRWTLSTGNSDACLFLGRWFHRSRGGTADR